MSLNIFNLVRGVLATTGAPTISGERETAQMSADVVSRAASAGERARLLQDRVDKLTLVCAAMWALLKQELNLSDEALLDKMAEMDLADGVQDGKLTAAPMMCPQCNRAISARHSRCIFCGSERPNQGPFDTAR